MTSGPVLHFDTDPALVDDIRTWAAAEPAITRIHVFGSRATGVRTAKPNPDPVPDIDLAIETVGDEPGERLAAFVDHAPRWRSDLRAILPIAFSILPAQDVVGPMVAIT